MEPDSKQNMTSDDPPSKDDGDNLKKTNKKKPKGKKKHKYGWLVWGIGILFLSFALTLIFSFITEISVANAAAYVCVIVLLVLLVINISCDMLANAIISCEPEPFLAMASNRIKGAKRAVFFCRNATKLSSIFADVIGDICGIVSGASGATLAVIMATTAGTEELIASIFVSAVIGALTVGGKAICKHFAIVCNKQIVFGFAKFTTFFKKEK